MDKLKIAAAATIIFVFGFVMGGQTAKANKATEWADTLSHVAKGDVVLSPGPVCVISADPALDETVFMGYLTSCRKAWDFRRSQQ